MGKMELKKVSGRGGKREGSGCPRKGNHKFHMTIRIDYDLGEYVNMKGNKSKFINDCIRKEKEREQ